MHSFEGIEAHETRRVYETGEIEWTLPGLTSFDGRQREAGGGVTKQRYTEKGEEGEEVEGWRGRCTRVESWKIKSVQFPGDTLSDLATPFFLSFFLSFFSVSFCCSLVDERKRRKFLSRDFEYLADEKRILTI